MIDIQYLRVPLTKQLTNLENNKSIWYSIDELDNSDNIDQEIKNKAKYLYKKYKNDT